MNQLSQQIAIERIVQNLDEPLREDQFVAFCAALEVTDSSAIEWALEWLSVCGLLINESPVS